MSLWRVLWAAERLINWNKQGENSAHFLRINFLRINVAIVCLHRSLTLLGFSQSLHQCASQLFRRQLFRLVWEIKNIGRRWDWPAGGKNCARHSDHIKIIKVLSKLSNHHLIYIDHQWQSFPSKVTLIFLKSLLLQLEAWALVKPWLAQLGKISSSDRNEGTDRDTAILDEITQACLAWGLGGEQKTIQQVPFADAATETRDSATKRCRMKQSNIIKQ